MKELFNKFPRLTLNDNIDYLIDTCFFIYIFEHHKEKEFSNFLKENKCAMTSFNVEELIHISHKISDDTRHKIRKFLHDKTLSILEVPVHPGNPGQEHQFIKSISPELDATEHDPSDAVLLAAAIKTKANILTRDKHDIFNVKLENFLREYNIAVYNKLVE